MPVARTGHTAFDAEILIRIGVRPVRMHHHNGSFPFSAPQLIGRGGNRVQVQIVGESHNHRQQAVFGTGSIFTVLQHLQFIVQQ